MSEQAQMGGDLFGDAEVGMPRRVAQRPAKSSPRVLRPNRDQIALRPSDLESLLADDHTARLVWAYVERQDLSPLYADIKAVEGGVGRSAIAPEILLSLWLFATLDGVGSARALARLCDSHDAYRWLCGGVQVNHHTLSDFRVGHGEVLDRLLVANVASLLSIRAVTLKRVAQDGMRVRAHAGAASFRRRERLEQCREEARSQVEALKREVYDDPDATQRRQQAARERAAREREQRITAALDRLPALARMKERKGRSGDDARASTSDPEASVMKMADGGFRPAYNTQLATDTTSKLIVAAEVSTNGSDYGQMKPMVDKLVEQYGQPPMELLVDGGYTKAADIESVAPKSTVYAPVQASRSQRDAHAPRPTDGPAMSELRQRMATDDAKAIYRERAASAEYVNACARNRGLQQFNVRGLKKVKCIVLWYALAHNLMIMSTLMQ